MDIAFGIAYFGFLSSYPVLQLWTLLRCRRWWRAAAVLCLVLAGPFYAWSLKDYLGYFSPASLGALLVAGVGAGVMLYLFVVALSLELTSEGRTVAKVGGKPVPPRTRDVHGDSQ